MSQAEIIEDILIPEADEQIVSTLRDRPEGWVVLSCGDDRGIAESSAEHLKEEGLPLDQAYQRYFGGAVGMARVAAVAATAQYGIPTMQRVVGKNGFHFYIDELANEAGRMAQVVPVAHSAVQNELNTPTLNPDSTAGLACAYAANVGEVTYLSGHNKKIHNQSKAEFASLFGPNVDPGHVDIIADANRDVMREQFGDEPRSFAITRSDLLRMSLSAMLLEGEHAKSYNTFLLASFSLDKLSDPRAAHRIGRPYYGIDFAQTAETIIKSLPELKLDPEIIFAAMIVDVCATRAALAGQDGPANPERISLVRYGDPEEALEYLKNLTAKPRAMMGASI